jgi:RNA polymerase sigma factor (sigma-70 family)
MQDDGAAAEQLLVARAQAGELAAFEMLVKIHQARVRQQLRRLSWPDVDLADDLAQETFVSAWQQLPRFRADARLSTWLHRIAYTRYLMQRRRRRDEPAATGTAAAEAQHHPDHAMRLDVARAVARLPEHERAAVVHCVQLELSHEEAAAVLGLPLGTLKSQVARGKARLREWLVAWQPETAA